MAAIVLVSFLTGYFLITGANYCTNPTLIYVTGAIALGSPAIVYVLLNRTIQREVLALLGLRKRAVVNHLQSKLSGSRI
ncbi:hypothetical protein OESDEN_08725 [Oesophagostomum dentatum]|uniref:Uncharacterized protein n=1 Tax=Oesophagostomum dentatum TaxID=61180 RepID=A0A0B1T6H8_OESDE|nr:hypothetical protein OESDEN_08725 [Oesophagostomum dentatum]